MQSSTRTCASPAPHGSASDPDRDRERFVSAVGSWSSARAHRRGGLEAIANFVGAALSARCERRRAEGADGRTARLDGITGLMTTCARTSRAATSSSRRIGDPQAATLESAIEQKFKLKVDVMLRTRGSLAKACRTQRCFRRWSPSRTSGSWHVCRRPRSPGDRRRRVSRRSSPSSAQSLFAPPEGHGARKLPDFVLDASRCPRRSRNWNTVTKRSICRAAEHPLGLVGPGEVSRPAWRCRVAARCANGEARGPTEVPVGLPELARRC